MYLFLPLSSPPLDAATCTRTPGGLLTAQRPLSAWVSSSRTPPSLPGKEGKERERKRGVFSHTVSSLHHRSPSASIERRSAVTDDSFIRRLVQNKRKKTARRRRCLFEV